ncbi:unnamed protein product [Rhizophagus irregularis]|nr:unnamed protein product [Rhizophagus irregularis]
MEEVLFKKLDNILKESDRDIGMGTFETHEILIGSKNRSKLRNRTDPIPTGTSKAIYAINSSNLRSDEILSYEFPEKRKRSSNGSSRTAWRFRIIKKDFLSGAMNNFLSSP